MFSHFCQDHFRFFLFVILIVSTRSSCSKECMWGLVPPCTLNTRHILWVSKLITTLKENCYTSKISFYPSKTFFSVTWHLFEGHLDKNEKPILNVINTGEKTQIHTLTHTYTHTHLHPPHTHTYTHTHTPTHTHIHLHRHTHIQIHT